MRYTGKETWKNKISSDLFWRRYCRKLPVRLYDIKRAEFPVSAGASSAIFAVMGAILWLVIKNKGKLDDISGRKFVLMIVLSVFQGYTSMGVDNSAHIGGLIMGFLLCMILSIGVKQSEDDYLTYD